RMRPIFHTALLRPYHFPTSRSNNAPPPPVLHRDHYKIEVLDECFRCGRAEYLVKW
ncbi:hypothetical protein BKA82DRAFT_3986512, partial [Pisolithus tinctorius]